MNLLLNKITVKHFFISIVLLISIIQISCTRDYIQIKRHPNRDFFYYKDVDSKRFQSFFNKDSLLFYYHKDSLVWTISADEKETHIDYDFMILNKNGKCRIYPNYKSLQDFNLDSSFYESRYKIIDNKLYTEELLVKDWDLVHVISEANLISDTIFFFTHYTINKKGEINSTKSKKQRIFYRFYPKK